MIYTDSKDEEKKNPIASIQQRDMNAPKSIKRNDVKQPSLAKKHEIEKEPEKKAPKEKTDSEKKTVTPNLTEKNNNEKKLAGNKGNFTLMIPQCASFFA